MARASNILRIQAGDVLYECGRDPWESMSALAFPADSLRPFYDMLLRDGTMGDVFYAASVHLTFAEWCEVMSGHERMPFFGHDSAGVPAGVFWLDDITGATCRIHFYFSASCRGLRAVRAGRAVTDFLLGVGGPEGRHVFQAVMGETPENNTQALRFAAAVGFKRLGVVERGCWCAGLGDFVGKVLSVKRRAAATEV